MGGTQFILIPIDWFRVDVVYIRFARLSRPFAAFFVISAVIGLILPALLGLNLFVVLGTYLAVPLGAGGLGYLLFSTPSLRNTAPRGNLKPLVAGFALSQSVCVLLLVMVPVRPTAYFLSMAIGATLVGVQILRRRVTPSRVGVILTQCIALLLNLLWGVSFKYEFFFGRTDVFPHTYYAQQLLQTGRVTAAFENYESFPLWHILAATERLYTGLSISPRYLFFFTNGVVFAALLGGIYLLARQLLDSRRIALTAVLLTAINPWVLIYGMYSIPRSVVSVLSVFAFVAMMAEGWRSYVVFLLLSISIVLYHTVSVPFILVVFGTFYVVQNVSAPGWSNTPVHGRDLLFIGLFQVVYWVVGAQDLFSAFVSRLAASSISGSTGVGGTGTIIPHPLRELVNYLQFSVLLLFVALAIVVALRSHRISREGKIVALSGALLAVVTYPGPMLLVGKLASNFNIIRFGQYTFPFIIIAAAIGVVIFADADLRISGPRAKTLFRGLVIVLLFSLAFLAVSNDFVASDNPTVEREFYTYYLTESETKGFETVTNLSSSRILADELACKYVTYSEYGVNCTVLQTNQAKTQLLAGQSDTVVIRTRELHQRSLRLLPVEEFDPEPSYYQGSYVSADARAWEGLQARNKVFATDDIAAYTNATG